MTRVRLGATAAAELDAAARWFEGRRQGLGRTFVLAVDVAIESLSRWPKAGTPVPSGSAARDLRRAPVGGFRYHVGYLVTDEEVVVLAVAHDRRRPGYWTERR